MPHPTPHTPGRQPVRGPRGWPGPKLLLQAVLRGGCIAARREWRAGATHLWWTWAPELVSNQEKAVDTRLRSVWYSSWTCVSSRRHTSPMRGPSSAACARHATQVATRSSSWMGSSRLGGALSTTPRLGTAAPSVSARWRGRGVAAWSAMQTRKTLCEHAIQQPPHLPLVQHALRQLQGPMRERRILRSSRVTGSSDRSQKFCRQQTLATPLCFATWMDVMCARITDTDSCQTIGEHAAHQPMAVPGRCQRRPPWRAACTADRIRPRSWWLDALRHRVLLAMRGTHRSGRGQAIREAMRRTQDRP